MIRSLSAYENIISKLGSFRVVVEAPADENFLKELGFEVPPNEGDSIIPASRGRFSEFNANGKVIIRKDLPKISHSRMLWGSWNDWHGNPHSGVKIQSIKIYPRERVLPPNEYIFLVRGEEGFLCSSRILSLEADGQDAVIHIINLFLELFGRLNIVGPNLEQTKALQVRKLHWRVLPPGEFPFARAKQELVNYVAALEENERPVVEDRIKTITKFVPDFVAVGLGGFKDYIVFGFSEKDIYILESPSLGNATYVFNRDWQSISLLTKKEILDGSLHENRLIHNHRWARGIRDVIMGG